MLLEQAIFDLLRSNAAVAALVGVRIYPHAAPQSPVRPYIVQARMDGANLGSLAGRGSVDQVSMAIGCIADDATQALALARAVRNALDGTSSDGTIQAARRTGQRAAYLDDVQAHVVTGLFTILAVE